MKWFARFAAANLALSVTLLLIAIFSKPKDCTSDTPAGDSAAWYMSYGTGGVAAVTAFAALVLMLTFFGQRPDRWWYLATLAIGLATVLSSIYSLAFAFDLCFEFNF